MSKSTLHPWAICAVCLALVTLSAVRPSAAEEPAASERMWRVELDALFFAPFGSDRETGAVAVRDSGSVPVTETYEPFRLKVDGDGTGRIELTRFTGKWGWGLSSWFSDGGDSDTRLTGLTSDSANGITTTLYTEAILPSIQAPDVGTGFLSYGGTTHVSVGSFQLYGARDVGGPGGPIELRVGMRLAWLHEERLEFIDRIEAGESLQYRLESEATTRVLAGPTVGLRGQGKVGKSTFQGWADLAVVLGDVEFDTEYDVRENGVPQLRTVLSTRQRVTIPTIELGARWTYAVAPRWGVGVAVFTSIWLDAPTPPLPPAPEIADPPTSGRPAVFVDDTFSAAGIGITVSWTDHPR